MNYYLNYSLSREKGLRGNIGKMTILQNRNGKPYMDVMLFLSASSDETLNAADKLAVDKSLAAQIVNVHFPAEWFDLLKQFGIGDFVRIHFDRIDLRKCVSQSSASNGLSIRIKANAIELLRKAPEKKAPSFEPKRRIRVSQQ